MYVCIWTIPFEMAGPFWMIFFCWLCIGQGIVFGKEKFRIQDLVSPEIRKTHFILRQLDKNLPIFLEIGKY